MAMKKAVCGLLFASAAVAFRAQHSDEFEEGGHRFSGLQAAASGLGIRLEAVHALKADDEGIPIHVRHVLPGASLAKVGGRSPVINNRRDLIRLLMKLNVVAYDTNTPYGEGVMKPVLDAGDSLYGPSVTTWAQEEAKEGEAQQLRKTQVKADDHVEVADANFGWDTTLTGVHALEFSAPEVGKVLVFRGSLSDGDYDNMKLMVGDWIDSKMTAQMEHQWRVVAGLPALRDLQSWWDYTPYNTIVWALSKVKSHWFRQALAKIAKQVGLDSSKIWKTGYWEFTKAIANSVRDSLQGDNLTITGHSQGGARAALTSMYFEKKYGEKHDTVTFAATGGLCTPRDVSHSSGHMLDDVDPFVTHDQVTEYVHPLDIYGFFDQDVGKVCLYGKQGISESRAKKYCEVAFAHHNGPKLMVSGVWPGNSLKSLYEDFARCRYFTHAWYAMDVYLMNDAILNEDGTTDGGCSLQPTIPRGDARCPS